MALCSADIDEDDSAAWNSQEESFTDLLRFVDVASSRIKQALDRPRHCRRRVNHRKYLARIHSGLTGNDYLSRHPRRCSKSPSNPSASQSDRESKRRPTRSSVGRHSEVRTTYLPVTHGSGSFAVSRQQSEHMSTDGLTNELINDTSDAVSESPQTGHTRRRGPSVSSSADDRRTQFTAVPASCRQQHWMTTVEPPYDSWYFHPAATCLPQQPQQRRYEFAAGDSRYQTGFRQHPCAVMMRRPHAHDYCDCSSSRRWFDASCGSAFQQHLPASAYSYVGDWPTDMSSLASRHDQNDNDFCCMGDSSALPVASPAAYDSHVFSHDASNPDSLHHQSTNTFDFNFPYTYSQPTADGPFMTPTTHFTYCQAVRGPNCSVLVDTSPASFNDSGLGQSSSFESATDVDGSNSVESSFVWPHDHEFCHLQPAPAETFSDSISVQTIL